MLRTFAAIELLRGFTPIINAIIAPVRLTNLVSRRSRSGQCVLDELTVAPAATILGDACRHIPRVTATARTAPVPEVVIDPALSLVGGNRPGRLLELTTGQPRFYPHRSRLRGRCFARSQRWPTRSSRPLRARERRRHGSTLTLATLSQMKAGDLTSALSPLSAESVVFSH